MSAVATCPKCGARKRVECDGTEVSRYIDGAMYAVPVPTLLVECPCGEPYKVVVGRYRYWLRQRRPSNRRVGVLMSINCIDCGAVVELVEKPHLGRTGERIGTAESGECSCRTVYINVTVWPTNREKAVEEIIRTGCTISAMLAVAEAFPLPGEPEVTARALERWREADPTFVAYLLAERDGYLRSWGRL